jgi:hypothetical protein
MSIDVLHLPEPARTAGSAARRVVAMAGIVTLAALVPGERLPAQSAFPMPNEDSLRAFLRRDSVARSASGGCLTLGVIAGDTTGRAMPRATGDSLVDSRMPRGTNFRAPCTPLRAASSATARLMRMPDGTFRVMPAQGPIAPPPR